jgi:hypothetical protein
MASYKEFDEFLSQASEDENLGNENNWFFVFRKAMDGFYNRVEAVNIHNELLHGWIPKKEGQMTRNIIFQQCSLIWIRPWNV